MLANVNKTTHVSAHIIHHDVGTTHILELIYLVLEYKARVCSKTSLTVNVDQSCCRENAVSPEPLPVWGGCIHKDETGCGSIVVTRVAGMNNNRQW